MSFSIERAIAKWIPTAVGASAAAEVPAERPSEFIAFEKVGGTCRIGVNVSSVTFDVYAPTRARAEELARELADKIIFQIMADVREVRSVRVTGPYNFPDLEAHQPRYQMTVDFTTE